jgi:outer membrane receptor protein involved in Fe transport
VNIADLPSILLIGLRGRYQVLPQAEVFLDIENLLNQTYEYWRRYQESPFAISAGVRIRW